MEAWGASGASSSGLGRLVGGKGAKIKGFFKLKAGEKLKILVAQEGILGNSIVAIPEGEGGGTFVIKEGDRPLVIAGGGGGEQHSNLQMFLLTEITARKQRMEHVMEDTMDPAEICVQSLGPVKKDNIQGSG